ncbi:coenzyme F420-0:L-glutamate ligase [Candidatus Peregrinibacteria bacterium]|nr:coenzyme F420-0:L-glutamate ligase [Candidatus Peregrinibacteria bacterium]
MEILGLKTDVLRKGFNLIEEILKALRKNKEKISERDVLIISSKIVALSQGRVIELKTIRPSRRALKLQKIPYATGSEDPRFIELILREADKVFPGKMLTTLKNGMLIPAAGIDRSNIPDGFAILWPKNPWKTAQNLWKKMRSAFHIKKLGLVICDSHCQPLRWGTTGLALAWAGLNGVEDARGQKDIFGKKLQLTRKAVADNLASSALLVMGEAGEKTPFAIIRNAPVKFTYRPQRSNEIFVNPDECIFNGVYNKALYAHRSSRLHSRH